MPIPCVFRRADGRFIDALPFGEQRALDPGVYAIIDLAGVPDARLQRWDGDKGLRVATAGEIAAYDASLVTPTEHERLIDALAAEAVIPFGKADAVKARLKA
jgi:hypothetical protein